MTTTDQDRMARLTNDKKAPVSEILRVMKALYTLAGNGNHVALYELRMACNNPAHKMFDEVIDILVELGLVNELGRGWSRLTSVEVTVKNIVLAAITGKGFNLKVVDPTPD